MKWSTGFGIVLLQKYAFYFFQVAEVRDVQELDESKKMDVAIALSESGSTAVLTVSILSFKCSQPHCSL